MNYYNEIKTELINNEITKRVKDYCKNRSDLNTYYNVGKLLAEAGKEYGKNIMKEILDIRESFMSFLLIKIGTQCVPI